MQRIDSGAASLALHRRLNQTLTSFPDTQTVAELFEAAVERSPDAQAVVHGETALSYHELNELANSLAWRLIDEGVQLGQVVAVGLERGPELIVSLLAILKAGAAYLPMDLSWPLQR